MKFISILPIKNMDELFNQYTVMLLAHLSQKYPDYAERAANYDGYKIMDNSIIEIGESFTMEDLVKEADKCKVQEIILPDVFNDGEATVEKVKESIEWLRKHNYLGKYKLMAVCHGKNMKELLKSFNALNNMPEIDVIGLPKVLYTWMGYRIDFARQIAENTDKEIHLLGCWETLQEYTGRDLSFIRSTDTCLPALLTKYGLSSDSKRESRKLDLENDEINIPQYRRLLKDFYKKRVYENNSIRF